MPPLCHARAPRHSHVAPMTGGGLKSYPYLGPGMDALFLRGCEKFWRGAAKSFETMPRARFDKLRRLCYIKHNIVRFEVRGCANNLLNCCTANEAAREPLICCARRQATALLSRFAPPMDRRGAERGRSAPFLCIWRFFYGFD